MSLHFTSDLLTKCAIKFKQCVRGYHLINEVPIKEGGWETINTLIFKHAGVDVMSQANGSHLSGKDITSIIGNFSNKSAKYETSSHDRFDISSYRLNSVCSFNDPGNAADIVAGINAKKNFQYYSIIAREECSGNQIHYDWLIIPADHPAMDPSCYTWSPLLGKRGKKKDVQTGWKTDENNGSRMSIIFCMSSQLWISIYITNEMKQNYIIASTRASKLTIMDYVQLAEIHPEEPHLEEPPPDFPSCVNDTCKNESL
jgi:hypothetical protein